MGVTKVIKNHPLGAITIHDKFHGNLASSGVDNARSVGLTNQTTEWLTDFYLWPSGVNDDDDNDDDGNPLCI